MTSKASTKGLNGTGGGILMSPFFPAQYPRDLGLEYIITCPSEAPSCRIKLLFSDFQLATVSIIEVCISNYLLINYIIKETSVKQIDVKYSDFILILFPKQPSLVFYKN